MRKFVMLPLIVLLAVFGLTGCSSQPVTYTPAAYGEYGHCYYVDDPYEVTTLQHQGLCQQSWTPLIMPLYWHLMYYPYYSSPMYVNTFVLVSHRTTYRTSQRAFGQSHKSEISKSASKAKYKGSNGKIVTGNKVKSGSFSGSRNSGSGGSRTKRCSLSGVSSSVGSIYKGGGGGSRGGGSRGSRSGSSSTKSRSGC